MPSARPSLSLPDCRCSLFLLQAHQAAVLDRNKDGRYTGAVQVGQDWLADAPAERDGPEHARLAVAFAKRVELAVVAAEEERHPAIAGEVSGDHAADGAAQVKAPTFVVGVTGLPFGLRRTTRTAGAGDG